MILVFSVDEQTVTRTDSNSGLANESVDYLSLSFDFEEGVWDNLDKKVEFYAKGTGVYDLELENDSVTVPFEVLTGDYFIFSLYGVDGDLRVTTNKMKIYLKESGFIGEGVAPSDDKRTVIQVINDRIDTVVVDVDALEGTVGEHTASLSTLSDDVTGLVGSVSALSSSVDVLGGDVNSLETVVNGHTDSINSLTGDVDDIAEAIASINDKLDNTIEMTVEYPDGTSESFDVVVK